MSELHNMFRCCFLLSSQLFCLYMCFSPQLFLYACIKNVLGLDLPDEDDERYNGRVCITIAEVVRPTHSKGRIE